MEEGDWQDPGEPPTDLHTGHKIKRKEMARMGGMVFNSNQINKILYQEMKRKK